MSNLSHFRLGRTATHHDFDEDVRSQWQELTDGYWSLRREIEVAARPPEHDRMVMRRQLNELSSRWIDFDSTYPQTRDFTYVWRMNDRLKKLSFALASPSKRLLIRTVGLVMMIACLGFLIWYASAGWHWYQPVVEQSATGINAAVSLLAWVVPGLTVWIGCRTGLSLMVYGKPWVNESVWTRDF